MNDSYVICGLGNPGVEYERTRHNVGFHLVDELAERFGGRWTFADPEFASSRARIRGAEVLLIKPQTYMNASGDALRLLGARSSLSVKNLLVVCDDIALPAGQLRLRMKGSDGGQKGLRSIIDALGTSSFLRLRLGVGEPPEGMDASDYVLIGSESPLPLGTAAFEAVMRSNERVRSDLAAIGANRAEDLLGLYSIGEQTIQRLTGGVELNTDDNMRIEYSAPLHLHTQTSDTNTAMLEAVAELPVEAVATPEGLGALATVYEAHDSSWRRTLAAAREAATRRPADESLAQLYATLRARAGAEGVTK